MKNDNTNDRRNFLKTAGAALVAASVPAAISAQSNKPRPSSQNNLKQMLVFGGVAEPSPNLPGVFGLACYQFQMQADFVTGSGFGTISDPVFSEINSHIKIESVQRDLNDLYIFQGAVSHSNSAELRGKILRIRIQATDAGGNCDVSLTIGSPDSEGILIGLLLPAVQKVR